MELNQETNARVVADSALDTRVDVLEQDPVTQAEVATQISAAKTELLGAPQAALDTLQELGAALSNDASFSSTVTNSLALKAPKTSPVFDGTAASFTTGLSFQNGQTCQGRDYVGNDYLLLRSISNQNIRIEPQGSGTCEVSKRLNCAVGMGQNGQDVVDKSMSVTVFPDVSSAGSGAILTAAERLDLTANTSKRSFTTAYEEEVDANSLKTGYSEGSL